MNKKLAALCLCAVLLMGGCAKWPVGWSVDELVPQPQRPAALPAQRALYLVPLEDGSFYGDATAAAVVDAEGNVVLEGEGLSLLRDAATGGVMGIVQRMGEADADRYGRRLARLYDNEGSLLRQWQPVDYTGGVGSWVLESAAGGASNLVNLTTGEVALADIWRLDALDEGRAAAVDNNGYVAAVVYADGTVDASVPAGTYTWLEAHGNYYIAAKGGEYYGWAGILDPVFRVLYSLDEGYITAGGEGFIARDTAAERSVVVSMPTGQVVFESPGGEITYSDDAFVVVQDIGSERYTLYTVEGEQVLESTRFLEADAPADGSAAGFLTYDERTGETRYVDAAGETLASRTDLSPSWARQVGAGRFALHSEPADDTGEHGWDAVLVDEKLETLSGTGGYSEITPLEGGPEGLLLAGREISLYNLRYDLMDADGKVLVEGLTEVSSCDAERLVAKRGFSVGLMDYAGNWLYERSAFGSLEDE